jgi:tripeptide aminopeptidase
MIIRDFDMKKFEKRKKYLEDIVHKLNKQYGDNTIKLELKDQYFNMIDKINEKKFIVDLAYSAMEKCDVKPIVQPIRGGTDGARLSFMGLACPNIFAGGHNFHGRYEFVPTYAMEKAVEVIVKIVELGVNH